MKTDSGLRTYYHGHRYFSECMGAMQANLHDPYRQRGYQPFCDISDIRTSYICTCSYTPCIRNRMQGVILDIAVKRIQNEALRMVMWQMTYKK